MKTVFHLTFALLLLLTIAVPLASSAEPILDRVPRLQEVARKANSGTLGDGAGTMKLVTSHGEMTLDTGSDAIHVFGETIKTADLITLLRSRAESNRTGQPGPMSGTVGDLCYVCLSVLAESRDPTAISVIANLLTDKDETVRGCSAIALFQLGDSDEKLRVEVRKVSFPKKALESAASRGKEAPAWNNR